MLLSITRTSILYKEENIMWNYAYTVPENKKVRVIVHTDCKNEADDQYAVAHHLMTPRFDVKGLVAGHFWKNPQQYGELGTAQASYDEIIKVMDLMGLNRRSQSE